MNGPTSVQGPIADGAQKAALLSNPKAGQHELHQRVGSGSLHYHDEAANGSVVAEYVRGLGGDKVIRKVLIANNGIAAVKAIRSIRRWSYETFGNEREIQFVVMATPEDIKVNAEYIRLADEFVEVPGGSNNNNYANVALIIDIAEQSECDAVWAGWGHASENPKLPDGLANTKTKIAFVGPTGDAMRALGDKIGSTIIAQSAKVSTLGWSGGGLMVDYAKEGIPDEVYRKACVTTVEEAEASASKIGYPIMIKASEGGGGKGIRKVVSGEHLPAAFRAVQGEVPGSPIFVMKLCSASRHLEVQVLADKYGNAIALFGRDCSVQRRHQKIMEEGPVVAAPPEVWLEMEKAAVRLAKTVNYASAGTVEYLYSSTGYYFLELNPRLQVEHPVTEWITDVNLPAAQLNIAMGIPLDRIPAVRRLYGEDPYLTSTIDFDKHPRIHPKGHVIASRITAENPDEGFQPTSGQIQELNFRSTPNVWGYFSVSASGGVHEYSDSQFGHLFAWGETREYARKNLVCALKELSIIGEIRTTVEYLIKLLETKAFKNNEIDTSWLDGLIAEKITAEKPDALLAVVCGGLHRAYSMSKQRMAEYLACLERGQIPPKHLSLISYSVDLIYDENKYHFDIARSGPNTFKVVLNHSTVMAEVRQLSDGGLLVLLDGKSHVSYAKEEVSGLRLVIDGKTCLFPKEYDPTQLRSNMTGKLVRHLLEDGAHVKAGCSYAEIEVMKMYMPLVTAESGRIHYMKAEGSVLEAGDLIAVVELDDPTKVRRAAPFHGQLPVMRAPRVTGDKIHQNFRTALSAVRMIMAGFENRQEALNDIFHCLADAELPLYELIEVMSVVSGRIPQPLYDSIDAVLIEYKSGLPGSGAAGVPKPMKIEAAVGKINAAIEETATKLSTKAEKDAFAAQTAPIVELVKKYNRGLAGHAVSVFSSILRSYITIEAPFNQGKSDEDVTEELRELHRADLTKLVDILMSHRELARKNKVVLGLLDHIASCVGVEEHVSVLHELAAFTGKFYSEVALKARQILISYQTPSYEQRRVNIEKVLAKANRDPSNKKDIVLPLVNQSDNLFDVLLPIFQHADPTIKAEAMEVYVRRAYQAYDITLIKCHDDESFLWTEWEFTFAGAGTATASQPATPSRVGRLTVFDSSDNLQFMALNSMRPPVRRGMLVSFASLEELKREFSVVIGLYPVRSDGSPRGSGPSSVDSGRSSATSELSVNGNGASPSPPSAVNVLDLSLIWKDAMPTEQYLVDTFTAFLEPFTDKLRKNGIKLITVMITHPSEYPSFFTFRERLGYREDAIYRHIVPPLAYELELKRLSNFNIQQYPSNNRHIHVYYAEEKAPRRRADGADDGASSLDADRRFFVRAMVRQADIFSSSNETLLSIPEAERTFVEALRVLEVAMCDARFKKTESNHMFINILPDLVIDVDSVDSIMKRIYNRYTPRLVKLRIATVELKINIKPTSEGPRTQIRFVASNPTGHVLRLDVYAEVKDPVTGATTLSALGEDYTGQLQNIQVSAPYPVLNYIQRKRIQAHSIGTSYVYDFLELFEKALQEIWKVHAQQRLMKGYRRRKIPHPVVEAVELVLDSTGNLTQVKRTPGQNDVGMVAWLMTLYTPEYPDNGGRRIILIANDITFMSGSFGPKEDTLFCKASEFARAEGIPRIYLAANSGARIGLANEVKEVFQVEWVEPGNPLKGFKYLYVTDDDFRLLAKKNSVNCERLEVEGDNGETQVRYRLVDIIGVTHGLGVENLSGSGMIAGETSRAYDDIFTLTFVTARTVGIGAYLVRLGQRVIQNKGPGPIILTGFSALNKVLGRDVYTSNIQIGGTKIMFANGVSHMTVKDDLEGVSGVLNWLSYVPERRSAPLPIVETIDPINRPIQFTPSKSPYDPRQMLAGFTDSATGERQSGFFDKGSFTESLGGWAKTVVTGRARLGGIPVGVIAVETRTVDQVTPADPANPLSQETVVQQAGQVWFPDSAYKTAQAIQDFNREHLPLMIFANWRGFSGGMRDMFDEILKFGSYIVDNLRTYKQPVVVYIPPGGELRGGAWVVIDSTINPEMVEMYADTDARGGVLEPQGIVEIKFRRRELLATMHRLDPMLRELDAELKGGGVLMEERKREIKRLVEQREEELLPMYQQVAVQFADLHDTPGRMKAKGVILKVVPWAESREFFYWRLRRRLAELAVRQSIAQARPGLTFEDVTSLLHKWLQQFEQLERGSLSTDAVDQSDVSEPASQHSGRPQDQIEQSWVDDRRVIQWLEEDEVNIARRIKSLSHMYFAEQVVQHGKEDAEGAVNGVIQLLRGIEDPQRREGLIESLRLALHQMSASPALGIGSRNPSGIFGL